MSERELRYIQLKPNFPKADYVDPVRDELADSVSKLADMVRALYVAHRKAASGKSNYGESNMERWDGGTDDMGRHHQSVWPKVAKHILSIGADPVAYIVAQFTNVRKDRLPLPNALTGATAMTRWSKYQDSAAKDLLCRLEWEKGSVEVCVCLKEKYSKWDTPKAVRYALYDRWDVQATDFVRYCLAVKHELFDIANIYFDKALVEYAFQKDLYDSVWAELIPELLKREGTLLVERVTT